MRLYGMECLACDARIEDASFDEADDWACNCKKPDLQAMGCTNLCLNGCDEVQTSTSGFCKTCEREY